MKNKHHSETVLLLVFAAFSSVVAGEPEDKGRNRENFAIHAYSNLNAAVNGELTPVFRSLGNFGELQQYFDKDRNPKKHEAYHQFIVQVSVLRKGFGRSAQVAADADRYQRLSLSISVFLSR